MTHDRLATKPLVAGNSATLSPFASVCQVSDDDRLGEGWTIRVVNHLKSDLKTALQRLFSIVEDHFGHFHPLFQHPLGPLYIPPGCGSPLSASDALLAVYVHSCYALCQFITLKGLRLVASASSGHQTIFLEL